MAAPNKKCMKRSYGIGRGTLVIGQGEGCRAKLLKQLHESSIGGHSGVLVTYKRARRQFYWPGLKADVHDLVSKCAFSQVSKPEHVPSPGLLQPIQVPDGAWEGVGMDFITGLPKSDGKDVILVVVDRLTKYCHL